ncbi:hypothetical protein [Gluconobacter thailandicus]|uniref:Uncharacterized protein n=1 Tax=Gluconobacter thailandicus TaxID=257438 RepID=A0AAP9EPL5_GLUTH|nr:hypothetical protein [Gluconobacter thailandicus]QEH95198.1 hypothetical protein FXF46_02120 [Gluconobacter thailandicus]
MKTRRAALTDAAAAGGAALGGRSAAGAGGGSEGAPAGPAPDGDGVGPATGADRVQNTATGTATSGTPDVAAPSGTFRSMAHASINNAQGNSPLGEAMTAFGGADAAKNLADKFSEHLAGGGGSSTDDIRGVVNSVVGDDADRDQKRAGLDILNALKQEGGI